MLRQSTSSFGPVERAIAQALYEAGQSDTEISFAIGTSVNTIAHWRKEAGLAAASVDQAPVDRLADVCLEPPAAIGLITPDEAVAAFVAPVQPTGDNALEMGTHLDAKVFIDLEELLTTRLLVQGNSGSGKSHLIRRLLEESAGIVQQIIIDPEGDFVGLGETFGHTIVHARDHKAGRLRSIAAKSRHLRGSVVVNLDGLDTDAQMEAVAAFLGGLFDAPREHWFPALVIVDEAHLFAPSADNGEDREIRKASQTAMSDLMCRGRKRGLAGIIATQRLAKLHKNVAAEASNFLMGRTFLDIDIARAADLLGLPTRQADQIRNLNRGEFLGLGPAIARRPINVTIGSVMTEGKATAASGIVPLPAMNAQEMQNLMLADDVEDEEPQTKLRVVK